MRGWGHRHRRLRDQPSLERAPRRPGARMSVTARIGREYLAQLVGMAGLLVDRVLLTGILLRAWGVEAFAQWSVAMAAAGMVAFFDFGLNLYFSNRLTFSVEQGK